MNDKLCIFDFDGTLVDTIKDVAICFNKALDTCGFETHPLDEYVNFVGGNLEAIVSKLLKVEYRNDENIMKVKNVYYNLYSNSTKENTNAYPNIDNLLNILQKNKVKIAINTNKKQALTEELCKKIFPNINFMKIIGYSEDYPSKPNPQGVFDIIKQANVKKANTFYIGDGKTDVETAKNAEISSILVTWGQMKKDDIYRKEANYIVDEANQILQIIGE